MAFSTRRRRMIPLMNTTRNNNVIIIEGTKNHTRSESGKSDVTLFVRSCVRVFTSISVLYAYG